MTELVDIFYVEGGHLFYLFVSLMFAVKTSTRLIRGIHRFLNSSALGARSIVEDSSSSTGVTSVGERLRATELGRTGVQVRVRRLGLRTCTTSSMGLIRRGLHVSSLHGFARNIPIIIRKSALFCVCTGQNKRAPRRQTIVGTATVARLNGQFGLGPSSLCLRDDSVIASLVCNSGMLTSFASRSKL